MNKLGVSELDELRELVRLESQLRSNLRVTVRKLTTELLDVAQECMGADWVADLADLLEQAGGPIHPEKGK